MDEQKLMEFVGKAVTDVGSLLGGAMVVLGDRLGLYRAMAGAGPLTPADLAERTGTTERYVQEWLGAMACGGIVDLLRRGSWAGQMPRRSPGGSPRASA